MQNNEIIKVNNLSFTYAQADHPALNDISLTINRGEWTAIIGHNGSGKSTLVRAIDGLLPYKEGSISVSGLTLSEDTVWDVRAKIGLVFQNPDNQFVGATVADDVAFGLENEMIPHGEMVERVDDALARVRMSDYADREPARLSGGQKQRVALAGIIAQRPDIVILDEATSMLDPQGREEVLETIRQLREETDMTVLSITHDIDEAASSNRIIVLDDGKLVEENTPEKIFAYGSKLTQMGLDVPYPEKLKEELEKRGIKMPKDYLTEEGMVNYLWTLHSKM